MFCFLKFKIQTCLIQLTQEKKKKQQHKFNAVFNIFYMINEVFIISTCIKVLYFVFFLLLFTL